MSLFDQGYLVLCPIAPRIRPARMRHVRWREVNGKMDLRKKGHAHILDSSAGGMASNERTVDRNSTVAVIRDTWTFGVSQAGPTFQPKWDAVINLH